MSGKVVKVSGPLVVATGLADANMSDVVRVGPQRLIGEILTMKGDTANIQVYEETSGLGPGAEVETTGAPMSVELGPGMIEGIYDGIQRPLEKIVEKVGACITRGVEVPAVDHEKKWEFNAVAKVGDQVTGGDILGTVQETAVVLHKIMVPPTMRGTITSIQSGSFNVTETIATLKTEDGKEVPLTMLQKWPVRVGRPYTKKYPPKRPLCSGQRIIDTMFPIAKGGEPIQNVASVDFADLRLLAYAPDGAAYEYYTDDGETKDYDKPEHFVHITLNADGNAKSDSENVKVEG